LAFAVIDFIVNPVYVRVCVCDNSN